MRCSELVHRRVQQLLHQLGQPSDGISESDTKLFCKHAYHLALLRGTLIADEYQKPSFAINSISKFFFKFFRKKCWCCAEI